MYNVCALVTVYFPTQIAVRNISILEGQVTYILIIDNTPNINNESLFLNNSGKVLYIANKINYGISKAFNEGLKNDNVKKSDYVLFLDQDSLLTDDLIEKLIISYNRLLENKIKIGCIGPIFYEKNADKVIIPNIKRKLFSSIYEVDYVMTSSMLTTYSALSQINFWNENIFLDLADWDLCWRFNSIGLGCFVTKDAILNHILGKSVKRIGPFSVKEGEAIRDYYQIRDCLKLLLKDYTPLRYKIRFILMITIRSIIRIFILPDKLLRIKYIFYGIVDFSRSINGPFDSTNK